jgi:hypothetical protein
MIIEYIRKSVRYIGEASKIVEGVLTLNPQALDSAELERIMHDAGQPKIYDLGKRIYKGCIKELSVPAEETIAKQVSGLVKLVKDGSTENTKNT